jgi:hypothetical protein
MSHNVCTQAFCVFRCSTPTKLKTQFTTCTYAETVDLMLITLHGETEQWQNCNTLESGMVKIWNDNKMERKLFNDAYCRHSAHVRVQCTVGDVKTFPTVLRRRKKGKCLQNDRNGCGTVKRQSGTDNILWRPSVAKWVRLLYELHSILKCGSYST